MTKKEAIAYLKDFKRSETYDNDSWEIDHEMDEALDIAIKALEAHGEMISMRDAIRIVDSIDTWQAGWRGNAIESLKALPSAQPEPSQIARDIATIIENEQDMRVIAQPEITLELAIITHKLAIDYLHSIGWMQSHDKQIYEDGQRSAQPEIIRCKDCKHRTYCYSEVHMTNKKQTTSIFKDIDFCSRAERRTDEPDKQTNR